MTPGCRDKQDFKVLVYAWAAKLDVPVKALTLRDMKTKWASCSSAGVLTFNRQLLGLEQELQEYVIVHELTHFRVPNHGKLWKSLMRAYVGPFEDLEERLRAVAGPLPGSVD